MSTRTDPPGTPYALGYDDATTAFFARRRAATHARFFLPHLQAGMRLLDCGSGMGSLSVELAAVVDPGEVVGIDIEPTQVAHATDLARRWNVSNARFQVGSATAIAFPDEAFDAVFSHGVVEHIADPVGAVREMRRVLKAGGKLGMRHADFGGFLLEPLQPPLDRFVGIFAGIMSHSGADPHAGRHQPRWLLDAGFTRFHVSASYDCWTDTPENRSLNAHFLASLVRQSTFKEQVLQAGLADEGTLQAMAEAFLRWGDLPEAFAAEAWTEVVAWK